MFFKDSYKWYTNCFKNVDSVRTIESFLWTALPLSLFGLFAAYQKKHRTKPHKRINSALQVQKWIYIPTFESATSVWNTDQLQRQKCLPFFCSMFKKKKDIVTESLSKQPIEMFPTYFLLSATKYKLLQRHSEREGWVELREKTLGL